MKKRLLVVSLIQGFSLLGAALSIGILREKFTPFIASVFIALYVVFKVMEYRMKKAYRSNGTEEEDSV